MHATTIYTAGQPLAKANKALIMLHGRGGSAADILTLAEHLKVHDFALLAPQATNHSWYPNSFMAPVNNNEPWLSSAINLLEETANQAQQSGIEEKNIYWLGFSQGACLLLEYLARHANQYGGAAAFTGGLIGEEINEANYRGNFGGTPVYIGTSNPDPHVPVKRVYDSAAVLERMQAAVTIDVFTNMGHTISQQEIDRANNIIFHS